MLFYYRQRLDNSSITNTSNDKKLSDNVLKIHLKHYDFYLEHDIYFHKMLFRDFLKINQDNLMDCDITHKSWFSKLKYYLLKR